MNATIHPLLGQLAVAVRLTGFEPVTYGLGNRSRGDATTDSNATCGECEFDSAFLAEKMPDLAAVVTAWPTLPAAIKAGILAMVKAASA
jgi:hypothetical protein